MAIVLSGHGFKCDQPSSFVLPRGFILYFWTREGVEIRDAVAGRVEMNPAAANLRLATKTVSRGSLCPNYWLSDPTSPPLVINPVPIGHTQYAPGPGEHWRLSDIMTHAAAQGYGDVNNPVAVHWCACRSEEKQLSWQQSLRLYPIRTA